MGELTSHWSCCAPLSGFYVMPHPGAFNARKPERTRHVEKAGTTQSTTIPLGEGLSPVMPGPDRQVHILLCTLSLGTWLSFSAKREQPGVRRLAERVAARPVIYLQHVT